MEDSPLHIRLRDAIGNRSYRSLAELTNTNPETTRRYLSGHTPSVEFLSKVCDRFAISAEWLLTGRGPMRLGDAKAHALQSASGGELLRSLATALEKLSDRVDRLEVFVQTLETRVRSASHHTFTGTFNHGGQEDPSHSRQIADHGARSPHGDRAPLPGVPLIRAQGIANALTKRPRQDAH